MSSEGNDRVALAGYDTVLNLHVRHVGDLLYIPISNGLIKHQGPIKHALHGSTRPGIPGTEIDIKRIGAS